MSSITESSYTANDARPAQPLRKLVQVGFLALNIWIGFLFLRFVSQLESGIPPTVPRPPGVEGYLPIGSLVSLKHLFVNGELSRVHPSGLVLFVIFILIALLLKKGFCSWLCPVGLASETLARVKQRWFPRLGTPPPWLDYILRGVKYLLLTFFVWAIIINMTGAQISSFIASDYNKMADIKMLRFFSAISPTALIVLLSLAALSVLIPYFWCRYLCPYGALLGLLSVFSPLAVRRNAATCINCQACTKACPALIAVHRMAQVSSDECHACYKCIDACPVKDTLQVKVAGSQRSVPGWVYAAVIAGFFILGTGAAQLLGYWQTEITSAQYLELMPQIDDLEHTGGRVSR